ncbi:glycyl-radical enzyme activating protein [Acetomicrobium sp. UBA5826]|uniref:glycyl-radical enzyme activating protein n=1 Tax=Acetomicrobium sp. UBA5826 TaxID=1946039 RepID=UPI002580A505|nr:glycyl-radical enzyme activating protein [Acetomicrobium sp. UBA5826]
MDDAKNSCLGLIFDVQRYSIHDGPGIRTTVFFKGCPLRCWWCHNPEGIDSGKELMYFEYKCMHCGTCTHVCPMGAIEFDGIPIIRRSMCIACGSCSAACPSDALKLIGREYTVGELMKEIERDVLYFDNSGGGVTFSGGEPLYQHEFLLEVLKECKKIDIHRTLDTSGFAPQEVLASVADYVDLFLYDLKLIDEKEHIKYTGVSNAQIKENLHFLVNYGRAKDIILRFPVIPGINDTPDNVDDMVEFISTLKGLREIDLLPYHDVSEKYNRLDRDYKMTVHKSPSRERLMEIKRKFEDIDLYVKL